MSQLEVSPPMCHQPSPQPAVVAEVQNPKANFISSLKSTLFILSTGLVVFVAFSNTLTWHLQHFWGASGDFWQRQWDKICDLFESDKYFMGVWGTFLVTFIVYWGFGILYTAVDLTGRPHFLLKYRIQDTTSYPVSFPQVLRVVRQVLINQILIGVPFGILAYYMMAWRGYDSGRTLPTFQWVLFELIISVLVEEAAFYYSHRLLHHPRIYKYIHKRHHEWTSPIAITAIYCHPVEHIFSNLFPPLLGPLVLGSHTATSWLWFTIALLSTLNAHSGFHFPFFPSPEAHDFHHLKFNQNYGVLGVLDRLHGTDAMFRSSKMYQRHIMLLSLVPIKQLYPDDPKKKVDTAPVL